MYYAAGSAGSAATLAYTGMDNLWMLSAAATLVFAGLALKALVPKRKRASK